MEFELSFIQQKMTLEPDTPISYSHILAHSMDIVAGFIFLMFNKQRDESP